MPKYAYVVIGLVVIVAGIILFSSISQDDDATDTASSENSQPNDDQEPAESEDQKTYTATEVATHSTETDCWTIISGKVYDITSYIPQHPGGDEILRACGKDGTTLFTSRETEDGEDVGSGDPHSSNAESMLASMQVGTLAN